MELFINKLYTVVFLFFFLIAVRFFFFFSFKNQQTNLGKKNISENEAIKQWPILFDGKSFFFFKFSCRTFYIKKPESCRLSFLFEEVTFK